MLSASIPARGAAHLQCTVIILAISVAILLGALAGYFLGTRPRVDAPSNPAVEAAPTVAAASAEPQVFSTSDDGIDREKARIIRSLESESWRLRSDLTRPEAISSEVVLAREERERLSLELSDARGEAARYRQLVLDIENKAPPPILLGAAEPDDLKLIVGIGPVLERMLHNLGVGTFRQIARWTERDVADFDAKLPEFPGRIVRDQWVTQARALHESKYGERP
jgi:predicted flap endonuclease-1-like 5' DNA nuclease